ncbi:MAG: hypothetical protein ACXVCR_11210 [Bdellovibrio sp.]
MYLSIFKKTGFALIAIFVMLPNHAKSSAAFFNQTGSNARQLNAGKKIENLQGGVNGGGGSVYVFKNQKTILWDFVANGVLNESYASFDFLPETPFYKQFQFDFMDRHQAFVQAKLATEKLRAFPKLKSVINYVMDDLRLVYVFQPLKDLDTAYVPDDFGGDSQKIETVIFYDYHFGGIVNASLFNRMGGISQAGLIFHETLRRLQLVYKFPITDEEIQLMTYYVFGNQFGLSNLNSIKKAKEIYAFFESQISGETPEIILVKHTQKWICLEMKKVDPNFSCNLNLNVSKKVSVQSIYGDWIVDIDEVSVTYPRNSIQRKKLNELRRIIELQLFTPNVLSYWNIWEDFPTMGNSTNFREFLLMFNKPDIYFKNISDDWKKDILRIMMKEADALKKQIQTYFEQNYFKPKTP